MLNAFKKPYGVPSYGISYIKDEPFFLLLNIFCAKIGGQVAIKTMTSVCPKKKGIAFCFANIFNNERLCPYWWVAGPCQRLLTTSHATKKGLGGGGRVGRPGRAPSHPGPGPGKKRLKEGGVGASPTEKQAQTPTYPYLPSSTNRRLPKDVCS